MSSNTATSSPASTAPSSPRTACESFAVWAFSKKSRALNLFTHSKFQIFRHIPRLISYNELVHTARVVELADTHDSKSCEVTPRVGSTPTSGIFFAIAFLDCGDEISPLTR